jgi:hypothetical protein
MPNSYAAVTSQYQLSSFNARKLVSASNRFKFVQFDYHIRCYSLCLKLKGVGILYKAVISRNIQPNGNPLVIIHAAHIYFYVVVCNSIGTS